MADLVPTDEIEEIVGVKRHPFVHQGRAVSARETVYILHSAACKEATPDLRECPFSKALDLGIDPDAWREHLDRAIRITRDASGRLIPCE